MPGNDDLFTALRMLQNSADRFATQRAIQGANEEVNELNGQQLKEAERLQGLRQIASNLTMNLAGLGAPAQTIEQVSEAITGPKPPMIQTAEQGFLMGNADQQAKSKYLLDRDAAIKASILNKKDGDKYDKDLRAKIERGQTGLRTLARKNFDAYDSANTMIDLINNNESLTDEVLGTFGARATGEVGSLTQAERDMVRGGQSLIEKWRREIKKGWDGKLPDSDRKQLLTMAKILRKGAKTSISKKSRLIATQIARNMDADVEETFGKILPPELEYSEEPAAPQGTSLRSLLKPRN